MARHEVPDTRDRLEWWGFRAVLAVLRAGSREGGRRRGESLGRFVARVIRLRRKVALENLALAFPEKTPSEHEAIYDSMCAQLGRVLSEFARIPTDADTIPRHVHIDHPEVMDAARADGRGAILLTAHFGNWEWMGAAVQASGHPVTVIGARQRNPLVESLFADMRRHTGMKVATVGKSLKPILSTLNANRFAATLADQDGGRDGIFVEFFGRPASVQAGLFRLAARRGVPIATGFAYAEERGWSVRSQPVLFPRPVESPEQAEAEAARLAGIYAARVEAAVRERPDHWFWVHRRWRTRPPGEGEFPPASRR